MSRDNYDIKENQLDRLTLRIISSSGQKASRRNFLTQLGKLTLALVGSSIASALPADRRTVLAGHGFGCTDWKWCYMSGYPCACCGGSNTSCPHGGCSTAGTAWTGCCIDPNSCGKVIQYKDCCATGGGSCPSVSCSCLCHNAGTQRYWCSGGTESNYRCTLAIVIGSCPC